MNSNFEFDFGISYSEFFGNKNMVLSFESGFYCRINRCRFQCFRSVYFRFGNHDTLYCTSMFAAGWIADRMYFPFDHIYADHSSIYASLDFERKSSWNADLLDQCNFEIGNIYFVYCSYSFFDHSFSNLIVSGASSFCV